MQLRAAELEGQLKKSLLPAYVIHGDEPLLAMEAADAVRAAARRGGFTEREVVDSWPLDRSRLPAWLGERLARQKQRAPREVLEFLTERVEGNLLAAHQELQKLALLAPEGELALETVQDAVASVARYDPYDAADALLSGDLARYVRVIEG